MVAFATDYAGESANVFELEMTLKKISEAGFNHIHWCHEWDGDYIYSIYEMIQIKQWMVKYGLKSKALHATEGSRRKNVEGKYKYRWNEQNRKDYTSTEELNRLAGVELIKNRIDLAYVIGAEEVVLHMQLPYKSFEEDLAFRDQYYNQVFKSFDELEYYCKSRNIKICVENLMGTPNEHQIYQFDLLFARYDKEFLGFCFDTGHGNVTSTNCVELAERYKDRIFSIHLSDNMGLFSDDYWDDDPAMSSCDQHRVPFEGNFGWSDFAKIIAESPYKLPCTIEVSLKNNDEEEFLKKNLEAGIKFDSMINELRGVKE